MDLPAGQLSDPTHRRRARLALGVALVIVLVWGSNFSVQKAVFAVLPPGGFLFARYLFMIVAVVVLMALRYGQRWPRVPRGDLVSLAKIGLTGHLLHVGLVTYGIHWSTPFSSSLILACGPVFTLLILRWQGTEHLARAQVAGVAIALGGVLVFLSDKLLGAQWRAGGGDFVLLFAASLFSYYTVGAKPLILRHGGVVVMAYAVLLGCVPAALFALPAGMAVDWGALKPAIWAGMLYAIGLSAFVGWIAWGWVNAVRGVARTAPLMYLMPPVAGLVAWMATGESYSAAKLGGAAITLAGVALAQFAAPATQAVVREAAAPVD